MTSMRIEEVKPNDFVYTRWELYVRSFLEDGSYLNQRPTHTIKRGSSLLIVSVRFNVKLKAYSNTHDYALHNIIDFLANTTEGTLLASVHRHVDMNQQIDWIESESIIS